MIGRDGLARLAPSAVPAALMFGVGLVGAGRPTLSWDEVTTADIARRSVGEIWHLLGNVDAVFGPYYFFMHAWTRLVGTTEVDLRLPSIIAMAAAVGAAGELGRRLFTPLVGLLAGLFLCLIPNSSRYAAEARPYAFTCLLSVVAVLLLGTALERGRTRTWIGYSAVVVLLGLSHLVALTTLAAHATMAASYRGSRRAVVSWAIAVASAAAVLLPVAWLGTHQQDVQLAWVDPLTRGRLYRGPGDIVGSDIAAWLLIGLAVLARWRPAHRLIDLAVLALAPLAAVAVASIFLTPLWVARYLLVVLAPAAILAAVAVVAADIPRWRTGVRARAGPVLRVLGILLLLAATAYPGHRTVRGTTAKNGPDYRGIAKVIDSHQRPGDGIVYEVRSRALRAGMEYYLRQYPARPRDVLQRRPAAEAGQLRADEYPDATAHVTGLDRVWLIVSDHRNDPTTGQPALRALLRAKYDRIGMWFLSRATVALFRLRGG